MSEHIIVLADRVKELSRTTGSGNIVLDGAATGFGSFAGSYTYNDALFYAVTDGINYEVGSGQYILDGSDDALTRFPFHSSNSNTAVDFPAGVKEVYVTYPGKYAVMTGSGLSGFDEPDASGLAFWGSNQILNYDSNVIWDKTNSRLGINNAAPSYTIDIGGEGTDSSIRVSGLIIGTSGITFSNGVQLTAYTENALDATTGTDAVFALSGVSNQIIQFQEQNAGLFFAGPPSGCNPSGACAPDMPTFRVITDDDLPSLASMYLTQDPAAYDSGGMGSGVAFWATSGVVDHDPYFVWDKTQNFLGVNKLVPTKELDVDGDAIVSGAMTVGGDLAVFGSLDVQGSLTYIDSLTVTIADHQIELGSMSGVAVSGDAYINDGGIVIKSQDSDKKWTWIDATDAWTSSQSVDVPSVIFDDSSVISGAYHSGSGISIANGIEINIADVFKVAGNDAVTEDIFQADTLAISGVSGVSVSVTTNGAVKTITIDPSALISDVESSGNDNSAAILANSASGLVISGIADTNSTNISTNIANIAINVASGITNALGIAANSADIAINSASGAAISGWASTNFTSQDGRITVNEAGILANSASGVAFDGRVTTAEAGILANSASGTATSGWASTNFTSQGGRLTVNEAGILANSASGVAISGFADYTIDASGALLDTLIDAVSGWSQAYTDSISFNAGNGWNISDQLGNTEVITNNNLTISGVSGLNTFYDSVDDNLIVSGGTLETSIAVNAAAIIAETASGIAISGWSATNFSAQDVRMTVNEAHILANTASGVAISGWAAYEIDASGASLDTLINEVSGWAAAGGSTLSAGSGLIVQSSVIHTSGTANFERIVFGKTSTESINIGTDAGDGYTGIHSVFVGNVAGYNITGTNNYLTSVGHNSFTDCDTVSHGSAFGYYAGYDSREISYGVFVGPNAGHSAGESDNMVAIGNSAGRSTVESVSVVGIGYQALMNASGAEYSVNIGYQAGYSSDISDYSINLGYRAGHASLNSWQNISAGYDAGRSSVSNTYTINLGKESAHAAVENSYCSFIGYRSGYHASGNNESIGFGEQAFYGADNNHKVIALGYQTMRNASGIQNSVMLGYAAAQGSSSLSDIVAIGSQTFAASSGTTHSSAIGYRAGSGVLSSSNTTFIGYHAGHWASGYVNSIVIGTNAGASSSNGSIDTSIGYRAGSYCVANDYQTNIGFRAGETSSNNNRLTNIGDYAGFNADMANYTVNIGYQAGYSADSENSVNIGSSAGYASDGGRNIYIGYEAGRGRTGGSSLIIRAGLASQASKNWGSTAQSGIIDIGNVITGLDTGYIRIGDTGTVTAIGEAALSVKPVDNNDIGLKLWRSTSTPSEPLAVAELSGGADNLFINKNGYLAIPTYATVLAATGAVSPTTNEGVVLLGGSGLLVTDGTNWYTIPLSLVV